jgi:acetolactate synthase small subunit
MPTATFKLHVRPGSDALHRVLSVCHRRVIEIVALAYGDGEMTLTIAGDERRLRQIGCRLGALRDVAAIREVRELIPLRAAR